MEIMGLCWLNNSGYDLICVVDYFRLLVTMFSPQILPLDLYEVFKVRLWAQRNIQLRSLRIVSYLDSCGFYFIFVPTNTLLHVFYARASI